MSIKLSYWLGKKKISLKEYCDDHGINSYNDLKSRCKEYGLIPVTEDEYKNTLPVPEIKNNTHAKDLKDKKEKVNEVKKTRTVRKRQASKKLKK